MVNGNSVADLTERCRPAPKRAPQSVVIIHADANAKHQAVISVMEAARRAGLTQITFATVSSPQGGTP